MTDREMLELAAKAGGYEIVGIASRYITQGVGPDDLLIRNERGGDSVWNPLEYDGDALRLAVKLRIEIRHGERGKCIYAQPKGADFVWEEAICHNENEFAATRRAVVRAAAEIGTRMA